jgi:hypothetical protein
MTWRSMQQAAESHFVAPVAATVSAALALPRQQVVAASVGARVPWGRCDRDEILLSGRHARRLQQGTFRFSRWVGGAAKLGEEPSTTPQMIETSARNLTLQGGEGRVGRTPARHGLSERRDLSGLWR